MLCTSSLEGWEKWLRYRLQQELQGPVPTTGMASITDSPKIIILSLFVISGDRIAVIIIIVLKGIANDVYINRLTGVQ